MPTKVDTPELCKLFPLPPRLTRSRRLVQETAGESDGWVSDICSGWHPLDAPASWFWGHVEVTVLYCESASQRCANMPGDSSKHNGRRAATITTSGARGRNNRQYCRVHLETVNALTVSMSSRVSEGWEKTPSTRSKRLATTTILIEPGPPIVILSH